MRRRSTASTETSGVSRPSSASPAAYETVLPPPPYGQHEDVRRAAQLLDDLEHRGLLAGPAVRVERVDEHVRAAVGELLGRDEGLVEVALDLEHRRAEHARLRELRAGHRALRRQHDRRDPRPGRVRRRARRGVPRRGAEHGGRALLDRLRDGDGHPAVLVRAGRVGRLPLEPELGDPRRAGEPRRGEQRRRALAEAHDRGRRRDREPVAEALDEGDRHRLPESTPSRALRCRGRRRRAARSPRRATRGARGSTQARPRRGPRAPRA